jgi:hypothetical protein
VLAPRFFAARHTARFPRNISTKARKSRCSLLRMTTCGFFRGLFQPPSLAQNRPALAR